MEPRIVELAKFNIDTDKLGASVMDSQKKLIDLNKEIYKSVQAIEQLQKTIDSAGKVTESLGASNKATNKDLEEANKKISELSASQSALKKEVEALRAERDKLMATYKVEKGVLDEIKKKNNEVAASEENVRTAVQREINTRKQAKENSRELNKLKDQLNVNNEEEARLLDEINEKVNRNNQLLKETGSAREQQIANIGNYSESIQDAFANLDIMNGGLSGFIQRSNEAGGAGNLLKGTVTQMTTAMGGLIKSTLAFLATPLGITLALLTAAFLLIRNAMNRSEEATNKINKVFGAFSGVLNYVLKALEPLGEFLIDGIVHGFQLASKAAEVFIKGLEWIGNNAADILESLGFDNAANGVRSYTNATTSLANSMLNAANAGSKLAEMEARLQSEQRKSELIQEQYEVRAERLRQLRDDETRTIQQRIESNAELGRVLKQQLNEELAIAKMALNVANTRLQMEGATTANLEAQMKAKTAIAKIENRITGQESEQQANLNTLRREAQAQAKAAADERVKQIEKEIAKQKEALELWVAQQGIKSKTLFEQYKQQEEFSKKSVAILDRELKNKKISQEKYDLEVLKLQQERAKLQAEISVEIAEKELDAYIYENQEKLKNGQLLTDALLAQELERNRAIANERDKFAKTQFENGLINNDELNRALLENQRAYLAEEKTLKEKNQADNRTIEATRRAEEFQANLLLLQENLASEFEIRKAQSDFEYQEQLMQLEQRRADGLVTEDNYQLALDNITNTHAQVRKQIEADVQNAKLNLSKEVFSGIAELVGEQTAMGKAAGIATATINTYQGVSEVWKSPSVFPEPYNTILKAIQTGITVASGLKTVKQITSVKTPSVKGYATGGKVTGGFPIKRSNGDDVLITAKRGEAILNERQQSFIGTNLLSLAGVPGFATGGVVGSSAATSSAVQNSLLNSQPLFDADTFISRVETAVQTGSQNGSQQGTELGSLQGISRYGSSRSAQVNSNE